MLHVWDAIIVGARVAGAVTALRLARRGHRVLLLDKAHFPSDTISTHNFSAETTARFAELGLLREIEGCGAPPLTRHRWVAPDEGVEFTGRLRDELATDAGYCIRRVVLDEVLVRAAQAAGAELREGVTVTHLEWDGDSVCGATAQDQTTAFREPARVVIGADGRYSRVARWVRAETYRYDPAVTPGYYAYFEGVRGPRDTLDIMHTHRRDYILFPTDSNLTCVLVALPREELDMFRADHERHFQAEIEAVPELRERFADARRIGPVRGATDLESYLRVPIGPGWALVGDAGAHIHPVTARGIGLAVHDAIALGDALADALEGRRDPGEALLEYHHQRDAETVPQYERALAAAKMTGRPMPPQTLALWRALGRLPDAADAYVRGRLTVRSAEELEALVVRAGM